jgi:hypothetical protein
MRRSHFLLGSTLFVLLVASLVALPAFGTTDDDPILPRFQYAAKFACTMNIPGTSQTTPSLLPGAYQTVIDIHNPSAQTVQLRKKIAVTFPAGRQEPGEVSRFLEDMLAPDEALKVDCDQILEDFGVAFIHGAEGFLVVESTRSLDVVAAYTAGGVGSEVASIAVEQIPERRVLRLIP